jgi:POT family proton-dependent oligopeptide transporter
MFKHLPKGVLALSSVEMWERFSFYSLQTLLVLYAAASVNQGGLGWSEAAALRLTALYGTFVYVSPILGGLLADRILGRRNAVNIGAALMCLGQLSLAVHSNYGLYVGFLLLVLGCGLLKPTISAMVGEFYTETDARRESGFALFYMAINIGGVLGPLIGGLVYQHYGYHAAFLAGAAGLVVALINFYIANRHSLKQVGLKPTKGLLVMALPKEPLTAPEKRRVLVFLAMCVGNILWNVVYALPYGLLTLYAEHNINRNIGSFVVPATWYFGLYGIFIVILCPLLASFYNRLSAQGIRFTLCQKQAAGYMFLALGCIILLPLVHGIQLNKNYVGSSWYLMGFYLLFSLSELLSIPVLLAAATRLAPKNYTSAMVSAYMVISWAFGAYLGGEFAVLTTQYKATPLFLTLIIVTVIFGILYLLFDKKVEYLCHKPVQD